MRSWRSLPVRGSGEQVLAPAGCFEQPAGCRSDAGEDLGEGAQDVGVQGLPFALDGAEHVPLVAGRTLTVARWCSRVLTAWTTPKAVPLQGLTRASCAQSCWSSPRLDAARVAPRLVLLTPAAGSGAYAVRNARHCASLTEVWHRSLPWAAKSSATP